MLDSEPGREGFYALFGLFGLNGFFGFFGVASVTRNSLGNYTITLDDTALSANDLIATATPGIDTAPTSEATIRIASVDQVNGNTFDVYINTGAGVAVDNDFMFMVTAR